MEYISLNKICDVRDGTHDSPQYVLSGYPLVTSKNIVDGKLDLSTVNYLSQDDYDKINARSKVDIGDIIMPMIGTIGNPFLVNEDPNYAIKNVALIKFPNKDISNRFIWYFLKSGAFKKYVSEKNKGGTQKFLSLGDIRNMNVPLVSLDNQLEIVEKLDVISQIIDNKRLELISMDKLIKARFVEMFGDPVHNTYGLPEATLPELGIFGRGVSKHRPRNDPKLLNGPYPLIQTGDVANSELYITSYSSTYSELGLQQSKMWDKGTLCITIAANIAQTAILTFDACFPDSVVGFMANDKTSNIFIHYWFSFFQEILDSQAPMSAQKNINLKVLSELKVITPDRTLQDEFEQFVKQVDKSKSVIQKSLDETQLLFNSLMQEYFG